MQYHMGHQYISINSWGAGDDIWWYRYGSPLAQMIVCCLIAHTITWTNVDASLVRFCGIHLRAIPQWVHWVWKWHIWNYCHIPHGPMNLPLSYWIYFRKYTFTYSIIFQHWDDTGIWNFPSRHEALHFALSILWLLMTCWCPVGPRWAPCWPHEPCYHGH